MVEYEKILDLEVEGLGKTVPVSIGYEDKNVYPVLLGDYRVGTVYKQSGMWYVSIKLPMRWPCVETTRSYDLLEDAIVHAMWHIKTYSSVVQAGFKNAMVWWNDYKGKTTGTILSIGDGRKNPLADVVVSKNGSVEGALLFLSDEDLTIRVENDEDVEDPLDVVQGQIKTEALRVLVDMGILD